METVTAIHQEKSRVTITLGNGETFTVSPALFRSRPITEGDLLDVEEYDQYLLLHQYRPALDRAVKYLSLRSRSREEIRHRLQQYGYREAVTEMVLYKLEREKLIDDADFARQWVQARQHKRLGARRIAQELRMKGIAPDIIEQALSQLDEDELFTACLQLAEKAYRTRKAAEDTYKTKQRITAMLVRRGYGFDLIKEVFREMEL